MIHVAAADGSFPLDVTGGAGEKEGTGQREGTKARDGLILALLGYRDDAKVDYRRCELESCPPYDSRYRRMAGISPCSLHIASVI